uniref:Uncharacterized protein n=1 Tax=Rhodococcus hoagii TaxID=43767 RepID=A0A0F6WFS8_RHOHA|nr:hypothetical protein pVAPN2012_1440 [Prescottella equi]
MAGRQERVDDDHEQPSRRCATPARRWASGRLRERSKAREKAIPAGGDRRLRRTRAVGTREVALRTLSLLAEQEATEDLSHHSDALLPARTCGPQVRAGWEPETPLGEQMETNAATTRTLTRPHAVHQRATTVPTAAESEHRRTDQVSDCRRLPPEYRISAVQATFVDPRFVVVQPSL